LRSSQTKVVLRGTQKEIVLSYMGKRENLCLPDGGLGTVLEREIKPRTLLPPFLPKLHSRGITTARDVGKQEGKLTIGLVASERASDPR